MSILTVLAIVLLQAENPAAKLFEKMEKTLLQAKTLQFQLEGTFELPLGKGPLKTEFQMDGDRIRIENTFSLPAEAPASRRTSIVSDGKQVMCSLSFGKETDQIITKDAPKDLRDSALIGLARTTSFGITDHVFMLMKDPSDRPTRPEFTMSELKLGPMEKVRDKLGQVVEYKLKVGSQPEDIIVQVWIDPDTGLPLKRRVKVRAGGDDVAAFEENFLNLKVDQKIESSRFELPKPK